MRHILLLAVAFGLCSNIGVAQTKTKVLEYAYNVKFFSPGEYVRQVTIKTQAGDLIASMEISKKFYLSVYADKNKHIGRDRMEFSGMISIRTKPQSEMSNGDPAEQMAEGAPKLQFSDAVVTVTTVEH